MKRNYTMAAVMIFLLVLAGCSGGGGGGVETVASVVSGVASKGIIRNGTVKVYALNSDGSKGALLKETTTDANGAYRAELGGYQGAIMVEASGSYTDEATGSIRTVTADAPLRAALDRVSGEASVAVTPLTELAVQKIEDISTHTISVAQIASSNAMIAAAFKVDILKTMPVDPTVAGSAATDAQKEHALVLAAIAELMHKEGKDLRTVMADLKGAIGLDNRIAGAAAVSFRSALADFVASGSNRTGINDITGTSLVNIGEITRELSFTVSGTTSLLAGVDLVVTLPPGAFVRADASGNVAGFALKPAAGAIAVARYTPGTGGTGGSVRVALASGTSFSAADFLALQCVVDPDILPIDPPYGFSIIDAYDSRLASLDVTTLRLIAKLVQ